MTSGKVSETSAAVRVPKNQVPNEGTGKAECVLKTEILDSNGKAVQTAEISEMRGRPEDFKFTQKIKVEKPVLWSPEKPLSVHGAQYAGKAWENDRHL